MRSFNILIACVALPIAMSQRLAIAEPVAFNLKSIQKTVNELAKPTVWEFIGMPLVDPKGWMHLLPLIEKQTGLLPLLEKQTGVTFRVEVSDPHKKVVTYKNKDSLPFGQALSEALGRCGCEYSVAPDAAIVVREMRKEAEDKK